MLLGYPSFMAKINRDIPKKKRGPPSQGGRKPPQLVRMDESLTIAIDDWRKRQNDELSRPEAIRRLVEIGLEGNARKRTVSKPGQKARAHELATEAIDRMMDLAAPAEERSQRNRRLTKGPSEFRDDRVDLPKAKGSAK